jgi:Spy/CpxP family protein refolding chaperone
MKLNRFILLAALASLPVCCASAADVLRPPATTNSGPVKPIASPAMRPSLNPEAGFTEAQSKAFKSAVEGSREQMASLWQTLRTDRRDLEKLTTAEKVDEAAIRAKSTEIGRIEGDLALIKAKALAQLRPLFSTQQMERLARNPQLNGSPYLPPRTLGTNEMKLRPQLQRSTNSAPPTLAPAVK